jgi:hypothetical protein
VTGSSPNVQLYELELASPPLSIALPGDYNQDGVVNAADYTVWRNTDRTQAGYNTWRANFDSTEGSGSTTGGAVPEPKTVVLLMLTAAIWWVRPQRMPHLRVTQVNTPPVDRILQGPAWAMHAISLPSL